MAARAIVALVLVFALAGCGGSPSGTQSAASAELVELTGIEQLRTAFTADEGKARLLLVLSPT
jgi:ABC-type glycerol-3-phosphate transport system substrate-binding protein